MTSLQEGKKARTSTKTKVIKLNNHISQLVVEEENLSSVPEFVNQLKHAFAEFSSLHEQLFVDEPEMEDDSKYYQQVQVNYGGTLGRTRSITHETT